MVPAPVPGSWSVWQDVVVEEASATSIVVRTPSYWPRGIDTVLHIEHDDGCLETVAARTRDRRPANAGSRLAHRVLLDVVPRSSGPGGQATWSPGRITASVPAALSRTVGVVLAEMSAAGCLLIAQGPVGVGDEGTLECVHAGSTSRDVLRIERAQAVAGAGTHRVGARFLTLAPPARASFRRLALRLLPLLVAVWVGAAAPGRAQPVESGTLAQGRDGWAAMKAQRFGEAYEIFSRAAGAPVRDAGLATGAGAAAFMLARHDEAVAWLETALRIEPRHIDAAVLLGEAYHSAGRVAEAIALYEMALRQEPARAVIGDRLRAWRAEAALLGRFQASRTGRFVVLCEGPPDERLSRQVLDALERHAARLDAALGVPLPVPVTAVIYTREQFHDVTRVPGWAAAAYDGRIRLPVSGADASPEALDSVVAHELVHALVVHVAGRGVPMWLNEGLATVLSPGGLAEAEGTLARAHATVALSSLGDGFAALPPGLVSLAYAESAVNVARLMGLVGTEGIVALLHDLGRGAAFEVAFARRTGLTFAAFERERFR